MKHIIKTYFTFNKRERNGILVLLSIIIIFLITIQLLNYYDSKDHVDFSTFENEIDNFITKQKEDSIAKAKFIQKNFRIEKQNFTLFTFNPNHLSKEQWEQLGLKDWQIKIVYNYEAKGGKFYIKKDLKKIYGIDSVLYQQLEPFIALPDNLHKDTNMAINHPYSIKEEKLQIELNTADTTELKKLKGIGSVYAKRIINYRNLLGGYVHIKQLEEVYGIKRETVQNISPYLTCDNSMIKKININICQASELEKHPYIDRNTARSIVNYRIQHGNYNTLEEILNSKLIYEELFDKIAPYLILI